MYCSSCGASVAQNLTYCNQCGAKLRGARDDDGKASEISPVTLVWAMVATFVIGMASIVTLVSATKKLGLNEGITNAILLSSFILLLALEGVFIWLLLSRRKGKKEVSAPNRLNVEATKELYSAPARGLSEPIPSVIENTTNLLEPIRRDHKSE